MAKSGWTIKDERILEAISKQPFRDFYEGDFVEFLEVGGVEEDAPTRAEILTKIHKLFRNV